MNSSNAENAAVRAPPILSTNAQSKGCIEDGNDQSIKSKKQKKRNKTLCSQRSIQTYLGESTAVTQGYRKSPRDLTSKRKNSEAMYSTRRKCQATEKELQQGYKDHKTQSHHVKAPQSPDPSQNAGGSHRICIGIQRNIVGSCDR